MLLASLAIGLLLAGGLLVHRSLAAPVDGFALPCQPYYVSGYNFGEYAPERGAHHAGQDIGCKAGTPIYAAANGTVVYSALTPESYRWGNLVVIEHTHPGGGKMTTLYGHMSNARQVAAGQTVTRGQLIGYVGPSYTAENGNWANHLHFQVHYGAYDVASGQYSGPTNRGYVPQNELNTLKNPTAYLNEGIAAYDANPIAVEGAGTMYYNSTVQVTFRVRNIGSNPWEVGGPNPVKLGTLGPKDRGSGFAMSGNGWSSPNRISLQSRTETGQVGTFTATFTRNNVAPGTYVECFAPVVEGVGWLAEPTPTCATINVQPPGYRYQYVKQTTSTVSSPTDLSTGANAMNLTPGQTRNFKVMLTNTGELPWTTSGNNPVRLGTTRPMDRNSVFSTIGNGGLPASENWLSGSRASAIDGRYDSGSNSVVADSEITTGETAVFSFTATASDNPGARNEYFQPVVEGLGWMPDIGMYFPTSIADRGYHYSYVGQSPGTIALSAATPTTDVVLQLKNTGQQAWPVGGNLNLATDRPRDAQSPFSTASGTGAWLNPSRPSTIDRNVTSPGKTTVDTNETAEFTFRVTKPQNVASGTYPLYVRPVQEGVALLPEDYGVFFPVTVNNEAYDYQFVSQTAPAALTSANPVRTGTIVVKNIGTQTWSSASGTPFRLGTDNPRDRTSGFYTAGQGWLAPNRIQLNRNLTDSAKNGPPVTVAPGENAEFSITFTRGSIPAGTYPEYFTPVVDGYGWLRSIGLYLPVTVQ
jgi:hypothetical protein